MFISFRGAIGAGKTAAASHLVQKYGAVRVSFADPLKLEVFDFLWSSRIDPVGAPFREQDKVWTRFRAETGVRDMFPNPSYDFRGLDLYYVTDKQKLEWVNDRKAKLRPLLQWWGTEYRRAQDINYWTSKARAKMQTLLTEARSIVMDDCRFDNEFEIVKDLGCVQVFIDCPNAERLAIERSGGGAVGIKGHASEGLLDPNDPRNDVVLANDGSLEEFIEKLDTLVGLVQNANLGALLHQPL